MRTQSANIAFFGTPHLAVWILEELEHAGIVPSVVVTTPDKPVGRKLLLTPPPVKVWAEEHSIPVLQPPSLRDKSAIPELLNTPWDLCIVAAYNTILPQWVLTLPRYGTLNVHPSLLPKYRGPSPIRSAILDDARDTIGVSIMILDEYVDHGPIVAQARVELPEWPVRGKTLDELLFREGGRLLAEVIPLWQKGDITPEAQEHDKAIYSKKFSKADGEIDLSGDGYLNYLRYCAMDGWPGTFFFHDTHTKDGTSIRMRVKIGDAEYTNGTFIINTVIPEGKREMPYEDFVRTVKKEV